MTKFKETFKEVYRTLNVSDEKTLPVYRPRSELE